MVLQLHALQEVWNLCPDEFDDSAPPDAPPPNDPAQLFMLLSAVTTSSHSTARSLQLQGSIGGHDIVILMDSGSTHSFLKTSVAKHLFGLQPLAKLVSI